MNNDTASPTDDLHDLARQFDVRMRLSRASELARCGRLLEAEVVLSLKHGIRPTPKELDMLARVHVRQGRYEDARRRWLDAAELDGNNPHLEQVEILDRWLRYRHEKIVWRWKLAVGLVGMIAGLTTLISHGFQHRW